jgi:hypothetical protein
LANGISISDADDFIYPVDPVRPQNIVPVDPNDPVDVREAKFENDLNSKTFLHHLGRSGDRRQKMDDDKARVTVMMLMQCSEAVRLRLRKSVTGAAAENGRCPRALIRALQVALCTNNRHDPLEKVDTARYALASVRAVTSTVSTLVEEQCTIAGLDPDPNDDADEEDQRVVDRNRVGFELHLQYVPTKEVITREVTGTLHRGTHGSWRDHQERTFDNAPHPRRHGGAGHDLRTWACHGQYPRQHAW